MAQYVLRKGKIHYEIAKFEDTAEPVDVYVFGTRGCSCPSFHSRCKHVRILDAWKKSGEVLGAVYNDDTTLIGNIFS